MPLERALERALARIACMMCRSQLPPCCARQAQACPIRDRARERSGCAPAWQQGGGQSDGGGDIAHNRNYTTPGHRPAAPAQDCLCHAQLGWALHKPPPMQTERMLQSSVRAHITLSGCGGPPCGYRRGLGPLLQGEGRW